MDIALEETMPRQEVLILAVTKMLSGVCTAGMTTERDPVTGLKWVRPVKDFGTLLLGDLTGRRGTVICPFDVVELKLVKPRTDPPHVEDWVTDFVRHRPRIVRRLEGERRADFLSKYLDENPHEVLAGRSRSLCLVQPDQVKASFSLDAYSGKYEARLAFTLGAEAYLGSMRKGGLPVTDVKWRALGREWLGGGGRLDYEEDELRDRLDVEDFYLALGLSRSYKGEYWLLVLGVHTVPDYEMEVDYGNL
jgi:hypothetical protein